jgi:hypothetical protein
MAKRSARQRTHRQVRRHGIDRISMPSKRVAHSALADASHTGACWSGRGEDAFDRSEIEGRPRGNSREAQELERFDRLTGSLHFPACDYAGVKITPPADGGAPIRGREGSARGVAAMR